MYALDLTVAIDNRPEDVFDIVLNTHQGRLHDNSLQEAEDNLYESSHDLQPTTTLLEAFR